MKKKIFYIITFLLLVVFAYCSIDKATSHPEFSYGQKIDSLNGVYVYYNGSVGNVEGRNVAEDGYNLVLKYQCVEFVKRYYYEHLNHKMPDSYGHAKSFFEHGISDGKTNTTRNLLQFTNPSFSKPEVNDLLVFDGTAYKPEFD